MSYLLDTNVFSAVLAETPDAKVESWLARNVNDVYTSAITIGEIAYGIERLPASRKRSRIGTGFERVIQEMGDRILRFDTRAGLTWGRLQAALESQGKKMPLEDSYIAAIAARHNLTVITRNLADFRNAPIKAQNPF